MRHSHALESRHDRGRDGPLSVLADQPDPCGGVGQRLLGRRRLQVPVRDQLTYSQAGPEQQPVAFTAPRGQQPPDDPVEPGLPAPAAMTDPGTGHRPRGWPGQVGDPPGEGW